MWLWQDKDRLVRSKALVVQYVEKLLNVMTSFIEFLFSVRCLPNATWSRPKQAAKQTLVSPQTHKELAQDHTMARWPSCYLLLQAALFRWLPQPPNTSATSGRALCKTLNRSFQSLIWRGLWKKISVFSLYPKVSQSISSTWPATTFPRLTHLAQKHFIKGCFWEREAWAHFSRYVVARANPNPWAPTPQAPWWMHHLVSSAITLGRVGSHLTVYSLLR